MGELKKWLDQKWVRIGTDGKIKGPCSTSKDKKILIDAYLPQRLESVSSQRATTAKKKKREGAKGKTVVKNTKPATVKTTNGRTCKEKKAWMKKKLRYERYFDDDAAQIL